MPNRKVAENSRVGGEYLMAGDMCTFMAGADDAIDAYVALVRENPTTTMWITRYLLGEVRSADILANDESRIVMLTVFLATAIQRLAAT